VYMTIKYGQANNVHMYLSHPRESICCSLFCIHKKENALFHEHAYVHASTGSLTPLVNELTDYVRKNHPCHLHHTVLKYTLVRSMLNNYFMNKNWAYPLLYYDVSEVISVITFCGSGKIPNSNGVQI